MLEKEHGVVIADGALEQALGIVGRGGRQDFQTGDVREEGFEALRVLRAAPGRADGRAHDQRDLDRPSRHISHLGSLIGELVHHAEEEIAILDVGDRAHAGHRRADGDPGDAGLGDRRIQDALVPELFGQAERHGEGAAEAARDADIFPQAENRRVAPHLLADSFPQRLGDGHRRHLSSPHWGRRPWPDSQLAGRTRNHRASRSAPCP